MKDRFNPVIQKEQAIKILKNLQEAKRKFLEKKRSLSNKAYLKKRTEIEEINTLLDKLKESEESKTLTKDFFKEEIKRISDSIDKVILFCNTFRGKVGYLEIKENLPKIINTLENISEELDIIGYAKWSNKYNSIKEALRKLYNDLDNFDSVVKLRKALTKIIDRIIPLKVDSEFEYIENTKDELKDLTKNKVVLSEEPSITTRAKIIFTLVAPLKENYMKVLEKEFGLKHLFGNYYVAEKARVLILNTKSKPLKSIKNFNPKEKIKKIFSIINRKSKEKLEPIFTIRSFDGVSYVVLFINRSSAQAMEQLIQLLPKSTDKKDKKQYKIMLDIEYSN